MAVHAESYEVIIRNGTVIDGTGAKRVGAEVAIGEDKILAVRDRVEGIAE